MMDRAVSGRKLVLGCAAFVFLLAVVGIFFVLKETARTRERREALLKEANIQRMSFNFLRSANPVKTSPVVPGQQTIAYWEVYSLKTDFQELVKAAAEELNRKDPAVHPLEQRGGHWEYIGSTIQVIILANTAYPEFSGQGDKIVFEDLPPLVTRPGYTLVRINYKRS